MRSHSEQEVQSLMMERSELTESSFWFRNLLKFSGGVPDTPTLK